MWESLFVPTDYWQTEQIERLRKRMKADQRSRFARASSQEERIDQLEADLGRALLLLHSLTQTCLNKGVLTADELKQVYNDLDLADGKQDGKLDPVYTRPPEEREAASRLRSPEGHLRKLEKSDHATPQEFLRDLEDKG